MTEQKDDRLARFEVWYRRDMRRLFNYISYRVYDKATAEELTAAICERALVHLSRYDPDRGEMDAWIFGIARNMIREHFRAMQSNPPALALDGLPEMEAPGFSPEKHYEVMESFRQVVRHLQRLPEVEQEVVALRYGAGLPNLEIAQLTGLTPNYVGVVLHRALNKLRQAVSPQIEV